MKENNICIFSNTLFSGGAEKQAVLLAKALYKKYQVWLVVYYGNKIEQKFQKIIDENQIKTVYLKGNHFKKIISFYSFLKNHKINIIFSYLLTTNLIGSIIGKLASIKQIYPGIRNAKLAHKKELLQKFIQNNLSTKTIYNNYRGYRYLSNKGFDPDKGIIIPNCFEISNKRIYRKESNIINILSIGRFVEQKDWFTAFNAIKILRKKVSNFKYYVIGYGSLENEIRNWVRNNEAEDYIEMIISPDDVNSYYKNADIYLMTSLFEGLSNTVLEAMSFSLPLVVTNAGDNDRLVMNEKNGYLCRVGDYKTIAEKLEYLITNYDKRIDFGIKSYRILTENYSFENFQQNYFKLIGNLEK